MSKTNRMFDRAAGILMPISSLPSPYGIGTFGREAYRFVDFVKNCRHSYWQVLPMEPTSYGDSPYQSYSAFAGNPYFVDLEMLIEEGLLSREYVESFQWGNETEVDYGLLFNNRIAVLTEAQKEYSRCFNGMSNSEEYMEFVSNNSYWLDDFSLFMACKVHFSYSDWENWGEEIKFRTPEGINKYTEMLADSIAVFKFIQFEFFKQWDKLKTYANNQGIEIIGDIPIYMALDSADVWANTQCFELDEELMPTDVAGVPPDAFTDLGQKWGNPLYDWNKMENDDFRWWRQRMQMSAKIYDVIRVDHFIGIVKYYTIPFEMPDAKNGIYKDGPGIKLTKVINESIGNKRIIAEDLGVAIPEVNELLEANNYPGMKVLEFAFGGDRQNPHLPYNYINNSVVYGGTHDNETLKGYFEARDDWELAYAIDYLGTNNRSEMVERSFRAAYGSVADLVIFQAQDILRLGNEARMNFPATFGTNWKWRMKKDALNNQHIQDMAYLASIYGRESRL